MRRRVVVHPLRAELHIDAVHIDAMHSAAQTIASFQHHHVEAAGFESFRASEACQSGTNNDDIEAVATLELCSHHTAADSFCAALRAAALDQIGTVHRECGQK